MKNAIDIELINRLTHKEQIQFKIDIIHNNELIDIPTALLPDVFTNDYFFISYSHKDFKEVYEDIFYLQENGLNIWYDRGIPAGKNWKDIASRFLTPFSCRGVIFYISENSLTSGAVIDELEYSIKSNKQILAITLPFQSDYQYEGHSTKGQYYPICEMVDILVKNNPNMTTEKAERIKELFPSELIFLPYKMNSVSKAEKIKSNLIQEPLLNGHLEIKNNKRYLYIDSIMDTMVVKVTENDFADLLKELQLSMQDEYHLVFASCCFANCKLLENVSLLKNLTISTVESSAFFGDEHFVGFIDKEKTEKDLLEEKSRHPDFFFEAKRTNGVINNQVISDYVGDGAFRNCYALEEIFISKNIVYLGKESFMNCHNLKVVSTNSFETSSLQGQIRHKDFSPISISERAFYNCHKLEKIELFPSAVSIEKEAFKNCSSLKEIFIDRKMSSIASDAFDGCISLNVISIDRKNQFIGAENDVVFTKSNNGAKEKLLLVYNYSHDVVIKVPKSVSYIDENIYKNGHKRLCFEVNDQNIVYASYNGSLYNKNFAYLYYYSDLLESFDESGIHQNTKTIGANSLSYKKFKYINVPKQITTIKDYAFDNCPCLGFVFLHKTLLSVGEHIMGDNYHGVIVCDVREQDGLPRWWSCPALYNVNPNELHIEGDLCYQSIDNEASVIGCIGNKDDYNIPPDITIDGKRCDVTSIGESAFSEVTSLKNISFGENVKIIGKKAFNGCTSLEKVLFPNRLYQIMELAFLKCDSLKEVIFPDSLRIIDDSAFYRSYHLSHVSINKDIELLGRNAFCLCPSLKNIEYRGTKKDLSKVKADRPFESTTVISCINGKV